MGIKNYIEQKLTYTQDGRLLDEDGLAVMMDWEKPIMDRAAEIICRNGGRVLNVGFGMGLIDTAIEQYDIYEHWIIEAHLDVYQKMLEDGWHKLPHVKILYGDWRWYLQYLPKFDGIYIDTWDEQVWDFHEYIPNILRPNGIYSFFNNPREDEQGLHMMKEDLDLIIPWGDITYEPFEMDHVSSIDLQSDNGQYYWHPDWKYYYSPVITLKK